MGAVGCSDEPQGNQDGGPGDVGTDVGNDAGDAGDAGPWACTGEPCVIEDPYALVPPQPGVDPDGGPAPEVGPAAGEARVWRIGEEGTGFEGVWSHCRQGDFMFANAEVRICVQQAEGGRYETYTGGKIVDAHRVGQQGDDVLDMAIPLIGFGTASADRVEVVRDGSDGGVAVLRIIGTDIELAHISGVLGQRFGNPLGLEVITEYRLAPDAVSLEMVSFVKAPPGRSPSPQLGEWLAYGDRARTWTPGLGFGTGRQAMPWLGAIGPDRSFGLAFEETASPLAIASSQGIPYAEMRIAGGKLSDSEPSIVRRFFMVGDGTLDSLRVEGARLHGETPDWEPVNLRVVDTAGAPVEGVELLITAGEEAFTVATTDAQGSAEVLLTPGLGYQARLTDFAGPLTLERTFEADGEPVEFVISEVGRIHLTVTEEGSGASLPARARFVGDGADFTLYVADGELQAVVPAGSYQVVLTRGMEYDVKVIDVEIVAGEEASYSASLVHGVETDGWISADFHQHMEPSIDSEVHVRDRVLENVTQGLELVVPTDHEVVTDLSGVIEALGLQQYVSTFPGVEISPVYSHFNLYPFPYDPDRRGRGSIELAYRDAIDGEVYLRRMPEVVSIARGFENPPLVQMNHPRSSSGMFSHVNYDPELGPDAVTHEDFVADIDAVEVINRFGDVCLVLADWSGLLNSGRRVTGLGNSDSHRANGEAGVPRNFLHIDAAPGAIEADEVKQVMLAQQVSVGSHAFIDFGDGRLPGDEIEAASGEEVSFSVRVQTPDWAQAERLFVIVNGSVVETIERSAEPGARLDFEETLELSFDEDSWVVFWVDGPPPSGSVSYSERVLAFTNPVYVKVSGAESWQAPGARALDLGAINTGYCSE
ncbi:hypothetical protein DL240_10600 [Lujinxingia litoralis]|uniref:Carboxypeptidase regulatory-like domain-containing protein n=2 Tax=Lujinxingia litoralis TaxID=2211119 RepID=A0A328C9I8_9DELT|nr:hypothetical protein DL240_10600 [Lujinxingia litoralis]